MVEVLLSAVSPMELMVGKILGQLAVGLLVLALYLGLGLIALLSFASLGLLDPTLIVFLLVFYLLAYFSVGAFMAAVGSSVNELREAQGMMTPVMLIIMIPWFLWMPISRDPNSVLATVLTFVPPSATSSSCCGWLRRRLRPSGRRCSPSSWARRGSSRHSGLRRGCSGSGCSCTASRPISPP